MTPASLKAHRQTLGLTQAQMAARIGLSAAHVKSMEGGRDPITPETAKRVQLAVARNSTPRLAAETLARRMERMEARLKRLAAKVEALKMQLRAQGTAGEDGEG